MRSAEQDAATQSVQFGSLTIHFDDRVLRPRSWTVGQSAWAVELLATAPEGRVLELCSGAGQIGLLTVARTDRSLVCVDAGPAACAFARRNAEAAGLQDRVEVREGRIDEALRAGERFALVLADPPWVRRTEVEQFPEDPTLAIDGGDEGLDVAWACVAAGSEHLLSGGSLLLQLGTHQQVERLASGLGDHGDLALVEVRDFEGGVVARLSRP